jgi:hypothetical protein
MSLGFLQEANVNRMSLVFLPLLIATAFCLDWLRRHFSLGFVLVVAAFLIGFFLFTRDYHGERSRDTAKLVFYDGFFQALDYARHLGDSPICVTNEQVHEPYIFVLFLEKMDPTDYLPTIVYDNPHAPFRHPTRLGRYRFGLRNCTNHSDGTVYVLQNELPLTVPESYSVFDFGNFHVYVP